MKKVAVLMSTYNGEAYLEQQIDSVLVQEGVEVSLLVRDDSSTDGTQIILDKYQKTGTLMWYTGENLKPAKSFLNLLNNAPDADYYAFCDQDDVWLADKLIRAIACMDSANGEVPQLYYGKPRLVNGDLEPLESPRSASETTKGFGGAVISGNATGCTMVINDSLKRLVCGKMPEFLSMHDAWVFAVCVSMGGKWYFDKDVHILYRQHGNNVIGISISRKKVFLQHMKSLHTKSCVRSRTIASLYKIYGEQMPKEHAIICEQIVNYKKNILACLKLFFNKDVKTGYFYRDFMFRIALLLKAY